MKSKRPLSINNSLCHGICNYNCRMCGVNKPNYKGPTELQPREVTAKLISEVKDAAGRGTKIRYIANSGDGEPTLHPAFIARMDMFGEMLRTWNAPVAVPEVSVVSNGSRLTRPGILEGIARNGLTLIISFPTCDAEHYGEIVAGDAGRGGLMLDAVLPGISEAMKLAAQGRIPRLCFHLSPPEREIVRADFPRTAEFLRGMAAEAGLASFEAVLFPATSNRAGLVRNGVRNVDFYRDLIREYHGTVRDGVELKVGLSFKRFFPKTGEILDLLRSFNMPCMWNAHMFFTAAGESICCNDQAASDPMGSIMTHSIEELMTAKEEHMPGKACAGCDQRPDRMRGNGAIRCFAAAAGARMAWSRGCRRLKRSGSLRLAGGRVSR